MIWKLETQLSVYDECVYVSVCLCVCEYGYILAIPCVSWTTSSVLIFHLVFDLSLFAVSLYILE